MLNPAFILIGIEDNKPQAIKALQQATKAFEKISVCVLPTKYPTGGEKQLIKVLTGKEVKSGSLPIHSGIVVQNVATCFAISDAVIHDIPLIKRVVTLTGQALSKPQNVWALLGTPVSYLLEQAGFVSEVEPANSSDFTSPPVSSPPVIMGGPLMGFSILNESVPIVKTSNCILAPSKEEMPSAFDNNSNEVECIRCGQCSDVCPSQLLPQELQWSAKANDHQQLTKLNLFDCIDCGACAYVCPSQIPLVQYYRVAKAEIRQQQQLDLKAEKAKARFEARKLRLEKEKIAREEKHKKAAAARKATMNKKTADGSTASSAIAAALARVKAKKNEAELPVASNDVSKVEHDPQDDKSQAKAAIARAKAKRLAKSQASELVVASDEEKTSDKSETVPDKDDKSQVKAAIARAKAKRLAKKKSAELPVASNDDSEVEQEPQDDKSQAKAAIARAKAKANAKHEQEKTAQEAEANDEKTAPKSNEVLDKKARVTAAVAKAKAKAKAQAKKEQEKQLTSTNEEST